MSDFAALFARTFLIGIAVAAPVGAMGVLCIQRTLAGGWRAGMATGLGIATADALYASMAAFGVAAVSQWLVQFQTPLRLVGGAVLIYLGIKAWSSKPPKPAGVAAEESLAAHGRNYASAVALTLTNPMTIMAFAAVFASAGLVVSGGAGSALVATLGVLAGSLAWWLSLTTVVALTRHTLSERALLWVSRVSGGAVAVFGVLAIGSVFAH